MNKIIAAAAGVLALSLAAVVPSQAAQLVTNGNFESGLSGWTVTGNVAALTAAQYAPCCGVVGSEPAFSSNHFASFGSGEATGLNKISQTFATVLGQTYNLTFDAGAFGANVNVLVAAAGGVSQAYTLMANNNANATFANYALSFVGSGSDLLSFAVTTTADSTDALLDNVSVIGPAVGGVPEPATWAMLLIGFFAIGGAVRSSRRHASSALGASAAR